MIYVFIVFLIFLVMGVPVAFAIGASGMVFFLLNTHFPLTHIAQLPLTQVQSISMLAIPLFILAGNLMNAGKITDKIFSFAKELVAGFPAVLGTPMLWPASFLRACPAAPRRMQAAWYHRDGSHDEKRL